MEQGITLKGNECIWKFITWTALTWDCFDNNI